MAGRETGVLVIGAGPFGLALAAHLRDLGIEHVIAGRSMSFWREHMPAGMILRSGLDWHLDVAGEATLSAFVHENGEDEDAVLPLGLDRYLDYVDWFRQRKGVQVTPFEVEHLDVDDGDCYIATGSGGSITARSVVVATGLREFASVPPELVSLLPASRCGHTCDVVDFERFRGRRVLIVGGRQSAFESAALLAEAGAGAVDVVYRHDTPQFTASDWSWVDPLMQRTETEPGWYRALPEAERKDLNARFWAEGRLKLEPWLTPRLPVDVVRKWPRDEIASVQEREGALAVELKSGAVLETDYVLLATGYRVDIERLPFLSPELRKGIESPDGIPLLDTALQSSLPGLYFTSSAAMRDFGPFFGFTVSARCSALLIGRSLQARMGDS